MQRTLYILTCIIAASVTLRAPIESFDFAAVAEMDQTLGNMIADINIQSEYDSQVAAVNSSSGESDYDYDYTQPMLNITTLSDRAITAARQAIYHESTSATRLHLLMVMNQVYLTWSTYHGYQQSINPRLRCDSIYDILSFNISLVPVKYREDTVKGWLLFCAPHAKFENALP